MSSGKEKLKSCCVFVSLYSRRNMAEARISVDQNEFTCPVCLDLLKDPVTIHCGHSYCKICITGCWDQEDQMRVYSCPQCRQTFSPRPALGKNTILAEMVEKLKKTKLSDDCDARAGDVECDVCTGRKYKAVKSCLVCLNSYCLNHLEQHESWFIRKETQSDWSHWTTAGDDLPETREASWGFLSHWSEMYMCAVYDWMIIKTTTLYQLQHRWQRNRYL